MCKIFFEFSISLLVLSKNMVENTWESYVLMFLFIYCVHIVCYALFYCYCFDLFIWGFTSLSTLYMSYHDIDRVFCPKVCLFKTDGWHVGTEFLDTQKTSISENYCHFKL